MEDLTHFTCPIPTLDFIAFVSVQGVFFFETRTSPCAIMLCFVQIALYNMIIYYSTNSQQSPQFCACVIVLLHAGCRFRGLRIVQQKCYNMGFGFSKEKIERGGGGL
jgi:hypothetical protein